MAKVIDLDKFEPRWYQAEVRHAIEKEGYRKLLLILPRRAGKDIGLWDIAIRWAISKTTLVLYCLPTFASARRIIWDAIATDGTRFLDYIPKELIAGVNQQQMKITLINGSIIQLIGADDPDRSLVGTNATLIIFSEFALMTKGERAFSLARPIVAANKGTIIITSTPRGHNHMYHLYNAASTLPDWKVIKRGTSGPDGTHHIDPEELAKERAQMDPGLYEQEFEVSFDKGIEGSIYGRQIDQMNLDGRYSFVPWLPDSLVHLSMDIGVSDATYLIWFQVINDGNTVRIIDCYSNNNLGLDHYVKIIKDKPYSYGSYFAPHDLRVREWAGGAIPRFEKAAELGIDFTILPQLPLQDGINHVWMNFNKIWIDDKKCKGLMASLENYRREWDEAKQTYGDKPLKNFACHGADALRYLVQSLDLTKKGLSLEEFERKRAQAIYGNSPVDRLFPNKGLYGK